MSDRKIRVSLDATAIGRGKTGNETYLAGLLEGWREAGPAGVEMLPVFNSSRHPEWTGKGAVLQHGGAGFFRRHLAELPRARNELRADLHHGVYWMRPWERQPFVLTVHDISFSVHPEWFRPGEALFYTTMIKAAARRARKVITVSEFCRMEIAEKWGIPENRIEVTHEAARGIFQPAEKEHGGPPSILFVGAIHPRKNLGRLIRACNLLRAGRFADLQLRVIGPQGWSAGSDLRALQAAASNGWAVWSGAQSDAQLKEAYQSSTMLVYPSLYEGFGLPPLEAMACGCPVVCSRTASLPEVCGAAAEYFDPASEEDVAAKIGELLESSARRETLRSAGLAKAAEYSWKKMARETAEIYRRAAEEVH